jgi:hypothetical protein
MRYAICITVLHMLAVPLANAQEEHLSNLINRIAEELTYDGDEAGRELLTEMLMELSLNPVRINSGDIDETGRLFFLTPFQVLSITTHVNRTGNILSANEIANLHGFTRELTEMIMPFVTFSREPLNLNLNYSTKASQRLVLTTALKFSDGIADPEKYYIKRSLRYRIETGNLTAILTTAGDAGEAPFYHSGKPDFVSGSVSVKGGRSLKNMIIGDFTARSGMGLVLNSGYKPYLAMTSSSYMGQRDGVTAYTSVNESNYLRGTAATLKTGSTETSIFISSRRRDARLKYGGDGNLFADILASPPIHNSMSSMSAKGTLTEHSAGVLTAIGTGQFRAGVAASFTSFSIPVNESGTDISGLFSLNRSHTFNAGVSYRFAAGAFSGSGEIAAGTSGAMATAHSVNIRLDDRIAVNLVYRNYGMKYYGHLSGGPGRNITTGNEEGLMTRVSFEAARNLFLYAGADIFHFPWLKQNSSFPSYGAKYEIKAVYEPSAVTSAYLVFSGSESQRNPAGSVLMPGSASLKQQTIRLSLTLKPLSQLTIRTNLFLKQTGAGTRGTMLAADCGYSPTLLPVSLWFRHAVYTTEGFDTALYLYENDMLYGFSVPALHGEGSRSTVVIGVKIKRYAELRLKYSNTGKPGLAEGKTIEEMKAQLKLTF